MNKYQTRKEAARAAAIDWQHDASKHNYSYGELFYYQEYFYKLAKRYGLIKEFRENAII